MSRVLITLLAGAALLPSSRARAADQLKFGPPAAWVVPPPAPVAVPSSDAPIAMLLNDQQASLQPGRIFTYSDSIMRIQNSQGLASGNISLSWDPATETVTIHKLQIRRGDKIIDVLASGQTFTTLRRETNLDAAMLDGTLTANIQPEGLQVGDIIELAATNEHSDPVLKGHVEGLYGAWNGVPFASARARLTWPSATQMSTHQSAGLPVAKASRSSNTNVLELIAQNLQPLIAPKGAPARFGMGRFGEATDFLAWSQVADLFAPLYRDAAVIAPTGALRDELNRIKNSTADPKIRAEQALRLVQDRTRYVALLMGQGSYVPAPAEETWKRRFGDCKGKTVLLLALLRELGVAAEPVLVNTSLGDAISDRLPMVQLFDHVLVRAHIAGKAYWLDGTRTGDRSLEQIDVPDFGWGLPLIADAKLVSIVPLPLDKPQTETIARIDASKGAYALAPATVDQTLRGDVAIAMNNGVKALTDSQRQEFFGRYWNGQFDFITPGPTTATFDEGSKIYRMSMKGEGKLDWNDHYFHVPNSSLGYSPDFDRPAGPLHDAPLAVSFPSFERNVTTIQFPPGFFGGRRLGTAPTTHETLAGVEYKMSATNVSNQKADTVTVESSQRALVPEIPYKEGLAAVSRLRELDDQDVSLPLPNNYRATAADLATLRQASPQTARDFFLRAGAELSNQDETGALADLGAGLALDARNVWALKTRARINASQQHYAEAEKDLHAAAVVDPSDTEVTAALGAIVGEKGDLNGASKVFDQALQRDSSSPAVLFGRAVVRLQQGKVNESLGELNQALSSNPNYAPALALRATILYSESDDAGADRDIAAALAADPGDAMVLASKAQIALGRRDYQTASDFIARALVSDPGNGFARSLQAQMLKRDPNSSAAMASFDGAVAADPHSPTPLINRALAYAELKRFDTADADIASALSIDPGNVRALQAQADIASDKGNFAAAVNALSAVLTKLPNNGAVLSARAEAYRKLQKFDLALTDTDAAMKTGLISPALRLLRINILIGKGDPAATAAEAGQLISENPSSDFAFVAAGKTYAALGLRDKAMASFDRALALNPQAYVYINRSQVRPFADLQGKLADLDQALKLEPDQDDALAEKARVLSRSGQQEQAIALYDHGIKVALDSTGLQLGRAVALQRAGRSAESKAAFDAVHAKAKTVYDFQRICSFKAVNDVFLNSALQDCSEALHLKADDPDVHETFALLLLKLGKLQDALAQYNKAIAGNAEAESYMGRAIVRLRLGDAAGAEADAVEAHRRRADIDDKLADLGLKYDGPLPAAH